MYDIVKWKTAEGVGNKGEQKVKRPWQSDRKCNYYK